MLPVNPATLIWVGSLLALGSAALLIKGSGFPRVIGAVTLVVAIAALVKGVRDAWRWFSRDLRDSPEWKIARRSRDVPDEPGDDGWDPDRRG